MLEYESCHGLEIEPYLEALGGLRIAVFREFPYLYEGTLEAEREYLQVYVRSPRSMVVFVRDGGRTVGATTCVPLSEEGPEFQAPYINAGYDLAEWFYFGESLLLPEYRGQGVGKEFMRRRLEHARSLPGVKFCTFCAVDRPEDHPLRPAGYRPLDGFWIQQGFAKQPRLQAQFTWKEIGREEETTKTLTFWTKQL